MTNEEFERAAREAAIDAVESLTEECWPADYTDLTKLFKLGANWAREQMGAEVAAAEAKLALAKAALIEISGEYFLDRQTQELMTKFIKETLEAID